LRRVVTVIDRPFDADELDSSRALDGDRRGGLSTVGAIPAARPPPRRKCSDAASSTNGDRTGERHAGKLEALVLLHQSSRPRMALQSLSDPTPPTERDQTGSVAAALGISRAGLFDQIADMYVP